MFYCKYSIPRFQILLFLILSPIILPGCGNTNGPDAEHPVHPYLSTGDYLGDYWPTDGWRKCSPEAVNMDPEKLVEVYDYFANPLLRSEALVIIKDGYLIAETYLNGFSQNQKHESFSVAKSFTSALVGITIDQDYITSEEDLIIDYLSELGNPGIPERKKRIKIQHLLTMTGGIEWNEDDYSDQANNDVFQIYNSSNFVDYVLSKDMASEPGTTWYYSSGESILLSAIVSRASGMGTFDYARRNLFDKLGVSEIDWESDPAGMTIGGWGIRATARDYAKFGYLYLKNGLWHNEQVISEEWVQKSTTPTAPGVYHYGYQWWFPSAFSNYQNYNIPSRTFIAAGLYTQRIFVVPENNLVVVRLGWDFEPGNNWNSLEFLSMIIESINE